MFQKGQKFFADWRDQEGRRKRKSFPSARVALKYETEQKATVQSDGRLTEPAPVKPAVPIRWEDDPLIRLIGSGKHIWADEHADEYVENLRRENI